MSRPPPTSSTALSITSRLRRPRKSIFSRPSASTSHIPNWVTTSWSGPFCCSGTTSVSGRSAITTPAAWIESWRTRPSSGFARSTISRDERVGVVRLLQLRARLEAVVEVDLRPFRDQLRDLVDGAVGDLEHAAGVADGGAGHHRPEGDDLRDAVAPVLLGDVVDDAVAAGDGEVDVHVRHRLAARVEEALEEQAVADRVDVGDLEAVGGEGAGGRAAAGADRDAVALGEGDEVPDDQEVVREAHLLDRLQLEAEALLELRCHPFVALLQAFFAELDQVVERVSAVRDGETREQDVAELERRRCSARRPRACGRAPPRSQGSRRPSPPAT